MPFPPCGPPEAPVPALVFASPSVVHDSKALYQSTCSRGEMVKGNLITVKDENNCDDITFKKFDTTPTESSDARPIKAKQEKGKNDKDQARNPFLVILTAEQAKSIYSLRSATTAEGPQSHLVAGKSSLVAEMYGVSPKTIRDVWNRKTWTQVWGYLHTSPSIPSIAFRIDFTIPFIYTVVFQVTRSLWSEEEADLYSREHMTPEQRAALGDTEQYLKRRGRPPGSKDARPRKRRY